jgi:hypothetical protein
MLQVVTTVTAVITTSSPRTPLGSLACRRPSCSTLSTTSRSNRRGWPLVSQIGIVTYLCIVLRLAFGESHSFGYIIMYSIMTSSPRTLLGSLACRRPSCSTFSTTSRSNRRGWPLVSQIGLVTYLCIVLQLACGESGMAYVVAERFTACLTCLSYRPVTNVCAGCGFDPSSRL